MKTRDRLTIHYRSRNGIIRRSAVKGMLWTLLGTTGAPSKRDEKGHVLDGHFERWVVIDDDGHVTAVWVHEDHLIDPQPPTLLSDGVTPIPKILSVADVVLVVANVYRMAPEKLASRSRQRDVLIPRQIAMALARRYTSASAATIAGELNRDHSAYAGAIRKIEGTEDAGLLRQISTIEKRLDALAEGRLAADEDRPIPPTFASQELPDGLPVPRPPEIQALYHLFEAAKLFKSAPYHAVARDVIDLGRHVARYTPGSDQWSQDVQSWIDSLGEEGGS